MTDSTASDPPPPQLDYSQRQRMAWVSRNRKKLILLALCIATAVPIWQNWQSLKHRVLWMYWSRRAAAHVMPATPIEHVIRDPQEVKRLLTDGDFLTSTSPIYEAVYSPKTYRELARYESRLKLINSGGGSVAFLGLRRRPDGVARLVLIVEGGGPISQPLCFTGVLVLPEPGWFDPLPPVNVTPVPMSTGMLNETWIILSTGVADPIDLSHIVFKFNGNSGTVDAYLQSDDSMTFTARTTAPFPRIWEPQNAVGDPDLLQKLTRNAPRVRPAATTLPAAR